MTRTYRSHSTSSTNESPVDPAAPPLPEPKYFAKHGHWDQAPNEVKKNGHGKFNWGTPEDEVNELEISGEFHFAKPRRRSNSNSKFDTIPAKDIRPKAFEDETEEESSAIIDEATTTAPTSTTDDAPAVDDNEAAKK